MDKAANSDTTEVYTILSANQRYKCNRQMVVPLIDYSAFPTNKWYIQLYNHINDIVMALDDPNTPHVYYSNLSEYDFSIFLTQYITFSESYNLIKILELITLNVSPVNYESPNKDELINCNTINRYIFMYVYFQSLHALNISPVAEIKKEVFDTDSLLYKLGVYFYLYFTSDNEIYPSITCAETLIRNIVAVRDKLPKYMSEFVRLMAIKVAIFRSNTVSTNKITAETADTVTPVIYNSNSTTMSANTTSKGVQSDIFLIYSIDYRRHIRRNSDGFIQYKTFINTLNPLKAHNEKCYRTVLSVYNILKRTKVDANYCEQFKDLFINLVNMLPAPVMEIKNVKYVKRDSMSFNYDIIQYMIFNKTNVNEVVPQIVNAIQERSADIKSSHIYTVTKGALGIVYFKLANMICINLFRDFSEYIFTMLSVDSETLSRPSVHDTQELLLNILRLIIKISTLADMPDLTIYKQLFTFKHQYADNIKEDVLFIDNYIRCLRGDARVCKLYSTNASIPTQYIIPFYKHDMYIETMHLIYCSRLRGLLFSMYIGDIENFAGKSEESIIKKYNLSLKFLICADGNETETNKSVKLYNIPRLSNIEDCEILPMSKYLFDIYHEIYVNIGECDVIAQKYFMEMIGNKNMTMRNHAYIVIKIETMIALMYIQTPEQIDELYPYINNTTYPDNGPLQFDILCIQSYRVILRRAVSKIKQFGFIQVYKPIYNTSNSEYNFSLSDLSPVDAQYHKQARLRSNIMVNVFNARCAQIIESAGNSPGIMPPCMICEDKGIPDDLLLMHIWICPICKQYVGHTKCLERYIDENTDSASTTISCPQCLINELF